MMGVFSRLHTSRFRPVQSGRRSSGDGTIITTTIKTRKFTNAGDLVLRCLVFCVLFIIIMYNMILIVVAGCLHGLYCCNDDALARHTGEKKYVVVVESHIFDFLNKK